MKSTIYALLLFGLIALNVSAQEDPSVFNEEDSWDAATSESEAAFLESLPPEIVELLEENSSWEPLSYDLGEIHDEIITPELAALLEEEGSNEAVSKTDLNATFCKMSRASYDHWNLQNAMRIRDMDLYITNRVMNKQILQQMGAPASLIAEAQRQIDAAVEQRRIFVARLPQERADRQAGVNDTCYDYATVADLDLALYNNGRIVKTSSNRWLELNRNGGYPFVQTGQDQWSIYLKATDRPNFYLQIDLWRNMIRFNQNGQGYRDLYRINRVSSTYDFVR